MKNLTIPEFISLLQTAKITTIFEHSEYEDVDHSGELDLDCSYESEDEKEEERDSIDIKITGLLENILSFPGFSAYCSSSSGRRSYVAQPARTSNAEGNARDHLFMCDMIILCKKPMAPPMQRGAF